MLKSILVFLLIQVCSGIRVRHREQKKAASTSFLKVLHGKDVLSVGWNAEEDKAELVKQGGANSENDGTDQPIAAGFQYAGCKSGGCGMKFGDIKDFFEKLLTDLPAEKVESLKQCQAKVKGSPNVPGTEGEVWVLMNAEKLTSEAVKEHKGWNDPKHKVLILGAPGHDNVGSHARNIYIPYASMEFVDTQNKFTPMHLVDRNWTRELLKQRTNDHIYAYQHHNCKANREHDFDVMCEALHKNDLSCSALGKCRGSNAYAKVDGENAVARSAVGPDGRILRTANSIERYKKYKFVEAFENNAGLDRGDGYITEKILTPFLAGAIPVHAGGAGLDLAEVFRPEAVLEADLANLGATADRIKYLVDHPDEYEKMVLEPVVSEIQMKKFFTWHPATWPTYGTYLRDKIIDEVISLCHS